MTDVLNPCPEKCGLKAIIKMMGCFGCVGRPLIHRLRMGERDRAIAKTRLMGRLKCAQVRAIAEKNGWLGQVPLPDDAELAAVLIIRGHNTNLLGKGKKDVH